MCRLSFPGKVGGMAAISKSFGANQFLFREGEPSRAVYLIRKGVVSIRKAREGSTVELGRVHQNEVLGELSFFDRLPRSASALAMTEVEALEIGFDALDKVYDSVPPYMKAFIAAMADRLRKANDTIRRLQKDSKFQPDESLRGSSGDAAAAVAAAAHIGNPRLVDALDAEADPEAIAAAAEKLIRELAPEQPDPQSKKTD